MTGEEFFEQAEALAQIGSWIRVMEPGGSSLLSRGSCRIYGVPEGTRFSLKDFLTRLHPDDRERVARELREEGSRSQVFEQQFRIVRPDGATRWVRSKVTVVRDDGDHPLRMVGVVQDLTDQRSAEARFARLAGSGIVGIAVAGRDGTVHYANDEYLRIVGCTRQDLDAGRLNWARITPPEWKAADEAGIARLMSEGASPAWEKEYLHKDGTRVPVLVGAALMDDGESIAFVTDLTGRKSAESELRKSEEKYRLLFESSPIPKWLSDVETHRFIAVNDAAVRHYGYSREEFLAMTILDIRPTGEVERLMQMLAHREKEAVGVDGTWTHRKKDGSLLDVAITSHPFLLDGRRCRLVVAQDRTEEKRLQAQLFQAQKMEAVGILAGGVAHDFNNILSVILTYSSLLSRDLKPADPMREDLECIREAGERAANLTRQLLAFSRKQVLAPRLLDLNAVVRDLEKMLRRVIGEDVELATVYGTRETKLWLDPGQIEQVIMNLAVNGRDAMPSGGTLTVELANVSIDESFVAEHAGMTAGPHVRLTVTDTGSGMDEATVARIFEPFFTTKEVGKGTGLGLSTVLGIVQQSGGTIEVSSSPGQGTSFTIYFRAADTAAAAQDVATPAQPRTGLRGSETVLIVDDEEGVAKVARTILERYGYRILSASNGGDALLLCEQHGGPIDLLLTDVVMPRMSGPQLARRLAPLRPAMKVLYVSGYPDRGGAQGDGLDGGAFTQKPIRPEELVRKVREVLDARLAGPRFTGGDGTSETMGLTLA